MHYGQILDGPVNIAPAFSRLYYHDNVYLNILFDGHLVKGQN